MHIKYKIHNFVRVFNVKEK